jgi:hypothetical protein
MLPVRNVTRMTKVWEVETDALMDAWHDDNTYSRLPSENELEIYMQEHYVDNNDLASDNTRVEVWF